MSKSDVSPEIRMPPKSLSGNDIILRECKCNNWIVIAPPGVDKSRMAEPSFWSVVASKLHTLDEITIHASDRSSMSRWLVLQAGRNYAEVHLLEWFELPAMLASVAETLPSNHKIVFDQATGFSAIRISDGVVICRADSQQECVALLLDHATLRQ